MKLLIDANILLDVLQNREPHVQASSVIWKLCETEKVKAYVSALTFADLVYIMRKELDPKKIEETLKSANSKMNDRASKVSPIFFGSSSFRII